MRARVSRVLVAPWLRPIAAEISSPLKPSARVCFELGPASDRTFRSLVAPLCLAQALVVTAGHHLAEAPDKGKAKTSAARSKNGARA